MNINAHVFKACEQAISRFYARLDGLEAGPVGAMFAADGVWHRQGAVLRGGAAVDAALAQRPAGRRSAHLISNLFFNAQDDLQIRASYLLQVFRHDAGPEADPRDAAPIASSLLAITRTEDLYQCAGNGEWMLLNKQSRPLFTQSGA